MIQFARWPRRQASRGSALPTTPPRQSAGSSPGVTTPSTRSPYFVLRGGDRDAPDPQHRRAAVSQPLIVAKAVATLDMLSDGRFTLSVAMGYMRGEYKALGVDFDERNALFDEAIEVIRGCGARRTSPTRGRPSRPRVRRPIPSRHRTRPSGSAGTAACRAAVSPATAMAGAPFPLPGPVHHGQDAAARDRG